MQITFDVAKEKGSKRYYAYDVEDPSVPVRGSKATYGTKKDALHNAAENMGIPYKEYMKLRRAAA